ncbi:MAG: trypsin-like peptidase domain-containing protein [Candidatus Nanopelagicales bacterium]|nr:trypsin-like peptidase domain-containing protein [Candidatus Nanopelagicales bacterium]
MDENDGSAGSGVRGTDTIVFPDTHWWDPPSGDPVQGGDAGTATVGGGFGTVVPGQKAREPKGGRGWRLIVAGAAISLVAGGVGGAVGYTVAQGQVPAVASSVVPGGSASSPADGSIAAVAAAVSPSVVKISAASGQGQGTGTGFIIRSDGYILTNNHVAGGADGLSVTFEDGSTADAKLVGSSPGYDLAVIKVDRTNLPVVTLGSSAGVKVGDTVIAFGSPLGLQGTVTSGIVSALDRPVTSGGDGGESSFMSAIQTDAAINPGNSGGPLVDGEGRVIGVNSAIASLGGGGAGAAVGSIGLGFAIPIDSAKRIADELIATGSSSTPIIGVTVDRAFSGPGARVESVTRGGPAAEAGLEVGDVIVAIDGKNVADATELIVAIRDHGVGDEVVFTVRGDGRSRDVDVTLGKSE